MRVRIDGYEVEGTWEEIDALIRSRQVGLSSDSRSTSSSSDQEEEGNGDDDRFASERIAYRALRRRPLSLAQRALFRALLDAYPNWTSASQLQAATGYNPNQLGGLLGAIGRRLSQTDGYVARSSMIEWSWDEDSNEYHYRLPSSVKNAAERISP